MVVGLIGCGGGSGDGPPLESLYKLGCTSLTCYEDGDITTDFESPSCSWECISYEDQVDVALVVEFFVDFRTPDACYERVDVKVGPGLCSTE